MSEVIYEKRGKIAYITLNRPHAMNAIDEAMHQLLWETWQDFDADGSTTNSLTRPLPVTAARPIRRWRNCFETLQTIPIRAGSVKTRRSCKLYFDNAGAVSCCPFFCTFRNFSLELALR